MTGREEPLVCLWQVEDRDYNIGIVGSGPGFESLLEIIRDESYREFMPGLRLVALAEPDHNLPKVEALAARGVKVYASYGEMLAAHPEIDILVELAGKRFKLKKLRDGLAEHVSLIDHTAAVFLCSLHSIHQMGAQCEVHLDRQRALINTLINEVREDILVLDRQGRIVDMNKNVLHRLDATRESIAGRTCREVPDLCGQAVCSWEEKDCPFHATRQTRERAEALVTRVNPQGRLQYFRVYSYPIFDKSGALSHVLVMRRDITARTYKEKHQQQVEKLTVIGEMSTYLAHEIRNPIMAIGGFANALLRNERLEPRDREKLQIIADETRRLDHMLSNILNFSRPSTPTMGSADLNQAAREAVELMQVGYAQPGLVFDVVLDPHLPRVVGQAEALKQCVVSLLKNSIEAMPGGGKVSIRTCLSDGLIALAVADTGRGMSDKELAHVFSPFYSTKHNGYGLGLAMIKKIVEEYGGRIEIASTVGQGATVTLFLPPLLDVGQDQDRIIGAV
ncbi:MAG: ATP-binding protein [Thermodesulfobacteriota bacterium]